MPPLDSAAQQENWDEVDDGEKHARMRGHPLPQATYTGVRTTVLGNMFFPSFLAKTKREKTFPGHIHCEIWPRSL